MRRILGACVLSIVLYILVFAALVDRPLSLGLLRQEMAQKSDRLAALPSPKLVIIAGSNSPYSHSCVVIGAMLNLPCENAGIAVGIGLDDLFARYTPLLHRGDIVYMPMELQQYSATPAQYRSGVDGGLLLRHDRGILVQLPLGRMLGAVFCCNLSDFLASLVEMPIARENVVRPEQLLASEYNAQGDRIDNNLADADPILTRGPPRVPPPAAAITRGYGTMLISRFVAQQTAQGVAVIGGLPSDFETVSLPERTIHAIASVYTANGGMFLALPNDSHYPVQDFFNSEDHLAMPCQYLHSVAVAYRLAALLNRLTQPPPTRCRTPGRDLSQLYRKVGGLFKQARPGGSAPCTPVKGSALRCAIV
jgi:hypothetical protein